MRINNKIPAVMVSNSTLRKLLNSTASKSGYKRDADYCTEHAINTKSYTAFVLDDLSGRGYGFGRFTDDSATDTDNYEFVSIDRMLDILTTPVFEPVTVKLNDTYNAEIQHDGSVKVGCQFFTKAAICRLLFEIEKATSKTKKKKI